MRNVFPKNLIIMDYLNIHSIQDLTNLMDMKVPDILMSGHHENINKWRKEQSIKRTRDKRPDLYEKIKYEINMFTIYYPYGIIYPVRNKDGPLFIYRKSKARFNILKASIQERLRRKEE